MTQDFSLHPTRPTWPRKAQSEAATGSHFKEYEQLRDRAWALKNGPRGVGSFLVSRKACGQAYNGLQGYFQDTTLF